MKMRTDFYGCDRRKNKFPVGEVMVVKLFVASLEMPTLADQLAVDRLEFCCNTKPVDGYGHEIFTLPPECMTVNAGAPTVCTTEIKLQNPPVR